MKKIKEIYEEIKNLQNYNVPSEQIAKTLKLDKPIEEYIKKYEETKEYLDAHEVANTLDKTFDEMYNYNKVLRLVREGHLKGEKPYGNRNGVRIHKDELERFIKEESKTKDDLRTELAEKDVLLQEKDNTIKALEAELDLLKIELGIVKGSLEKEPVKAKEKVQPKEEEVVVVEENVQAEQEKDEIEPTPSKEEEETIENNGNSDDQNEDQETKIKNLGEIKAIVGVTKEKEVLEGSIYNVEFSVNKLKGEQFQGRVKKLNDGNYHLTFAESISRSFSLTDERESDMETLEKITKYLIPKMKKLK